MQNEQLSRAELVHGLYTGCFQNLLNSTTTRNLNRDSARRLVEGLEPHLASFDGPVDDPYAFLLWANAILTPASTAFVLIEQNRKMIESAFSRVLASCPDFCSREPNHRSEIYSDLLLWIIDHLPELLKPGTAKLSTRLYAAARFAALTWRKARIRHRQRFTASAEDVEKQLIFRGTRREQGKLPYFVTGWAAEAESLENKSVIAA